VALAASRTARAEGPGVRLGEQLVLHPGVAAEIRYDSNIFYTASNELQAAILRILPSIDLATRPAQRGGSTPHMIDFRFHAGLDYREYLTGNTLISQHRQFGVLGSMLLAINPFGVFGVEIFDNYVRTTQPPYSTVSYNLDRDTNEVGARFRLRPGGGRLEVNLTYVFGIDLFEVPVLQDFNLFYHKLILHAAWKFFPKTAVYIDASDTIYQYRQPGSYMHPDSYPLRVVAGIQGLITTKLNLNAWIGYGNGFYVTGANPNTAIGGLDLRWKPTMLSTGTLGYKHDFQNSLLGSFYDLDSVYIGWAQLMWRITGSVRAIYSNIRYQEIPTLTGLCSTTGMPCSRTDNTFQLNVRFDLPIKDYLIASIGYDLTLNRSGSQIVNPAAVPAGVIPVDFTKHEVWAQLNLAY
jgi:hypothetical protein